MTEPVGQTFGASGSQGEAEDLDLGKPWDFLAVDWARNQIVKILRRLAQVEVHGGEAARVIDELSEELAGVQRKLQDDNARISKLEARAIRDTGEYFEKWADRQLEKGASLVRGLERRIEELEGNPTCVTPELLDRITALENGIASMSDQGNADRERVNDVWSAIVEIQAALQNYGIPLGGRAAPTKAEFFANLYGMSPTGRTIGNPGAMTENPLDEAERRVRQYLTERAFSDETIEDLTACIRGTLGGVVQGETYGGRLPLGHLFRTNGTDRRHCSHRFNHRGMPCGKLASEH